MAILVKPLFRAVQTNALIKDFIDPFNKACFSIRVLSINFWVSISLIGKKKLLSSKKYEIGTPTYTKKLIDFFI